MREGQISRNLKVGGKRSQRETFHCRMFGKQRVFDITRELTRQDEKEFSGAKQEVLQIYD